MRTELWALRSVAAHRRALALAVAVSGFLAISFLGVRDLHLTAEVDAESALSSGAVTGFVAVVYAAARAREARSPAEASRSRCSPITTARRRSGIGSARPRPRPEPSSAPPGR